MAGDQGTPWRGTQGVTKPQFQSPNPWTQHVPLSPGLPVPQMRTIQPFPYAFLFQVWESHPGGASILRTQLQKVLETKRSSQKMVLPPNFHVVSPQPFGRKLCLWFDHQPSITLGPELPHGPRSSESFSHLYDTGRCVLNCTRSALWFSHHIHLRIYIFIFINLSLWT